MDEKGQVRTRAGVVSVERLVRSSSRHGSAPGQEGLEEQLGQKTTTAGDNNDDDANCAGHKTLRRRRREQQSDQGATPPGALERMFWSDAEKPVPSLDVQPSSGKPAEEKRQRKRKKRKEKKTRCRKLTARVCWHRILCRFDGVDPVRVQVLSQGARSGDPAAPWFFSAQHEPVALTSQSACSSILCLDALIGYGKY